MELETEEYRILITPLKEGLEFKFMVEYPDLPGCRAFGMNLEDAFLNAKNRKEQWLQSAWRLFEKSDEFGYSENAIDMRTYFILKIPRILYAKACKQAKNISFSLEKYLLDCLKDGIEKSKIT